MFQRSVDYRCLGLASRTGTIEKLGATRNNETKLNLHADNLHGGRIAIEAEVERITLYLIIGVAWLSLGVAAASMATDVLEPNTGLERLRSRTRSSQKLLKSFGSRLFRDKILS